MTCRAFESFASFDPARGDFRGWVFGIARRVLYQALQRLQVPSSGGAGEGPATLSDVVDTATSITRRVVRQENLDRFLESAAALSDEDRRLLLYRGLEGLSHEEVGRQLGTTARAAAKRWERLCARLQGTLEARGILVA